MQEVSQEIYGQKDEWKRTSNSGASQQHQETYKEITRT